MYGIYNNENKVYLTFDDGPPKNYRMGFRTVESTQCDYFLFASKNQKPTKLTFTKTINGHIVQGITL
jgi:hypothetical protein